LALAVDDLVGVGLAVAVPLAVADGVAEESTPEAVSFSAFWTRARTAVQFGS
jgi:hypothetical protein